MVEGKTTIPDAYRKAQERTSWRQLVHGVAERQCGGGGGGGGENRFTVVLFAHVPHFFAVGQITDHGWPYSAYRLYFGDPWSDLLWFFTLWTKK